MRAWASVDAPAKINLFLRILDRRADGFHELETLFQAVSLSDEVRVTLGQVADASAGIELHVDGPDLGPPEENLAYRAAEAFLTLSGRSAAVRIDLAKRIPAGAGLGGGSSDAAAVLKCLAALTGYADDDSLHAVAADLGSDVPFFLGSSALAEGRGKGEVLTEVAPLPEASLVLALPDVHVATGGAYAALAASRAKGEGAARGPGARTPAGIPASWDDVAVVAHNDFETIVASKHSDVAASLEGLRSRGARFALLSGSGAASFGLFGGDDEAGSAARWLEARYGFPFVGVRTLRTLPAPRVEQG